MTLNEAQSDFILDRLAEGFGVEDIAIQLVKDGRADCSQADLHAPIRAYVADLRKAGLLAELLGVRE